MSTDHADPQRDALLQLLARVNAELKDTPGTSFGVVLDGQGNAYFQDPDEANTPELPLP
jgi:hypothetical protein